MGEGGCKTRWCIDAHVRMHDSKLWFPLFHIRKHRTKYMFRINKVSALHTILFDRLLTASVTSNQLVYMYVYGVRDLNWAIPLINRTPPRMTKMCVLGSCLLFVQGACMGANRYVSWGGGVM